MNILLIMLIAIAVVIVVPATILSLWWIYEGKDHEENRRSLMTQEERDAEDRAEHLDRMIW